MLTSRSERWPKGIGREPAQRLGLAALDLATAFIAVHDGVGELLGGAMRPEKNAGRDGRELLDQPPRLGQVIEQPGAEDHVELPELGELHLLEIAGEELDVFHGEKLLRETRSREAGCASFHADDLFDAGQAGEADGVPAFQRAELEDAPRFRETAPEKGEPGVVRGVEPAAGILAAQLVFRDPGLVLSKGRGDGGIGHRAE